MPEGMDSLLEIRNDRHIPLLCTVCPDTPRFSDVSHLLTHIASKGHLHHETQTKLKSHQDLVAAIALQHYEQWYRDYGIETLLVERMKAKQVKEAARHRPSRGRPPTISTPIMPRKRSRRASPDTVKVKSEETTDDFTLYPELFSGENEAECSEYLASRNDMMSLKGQVWPGMGKMDLADEDMKRTRNQRKPKSAIEKMRRTSEGIEPNQVVMTPDFKVERVKGVYDDSSSPIPGQEESTPPRKIHRPRRKVAEPLSEISGNIPRTTRRRGSSRATKTTAFSGSSRNSESTSGTNQRAPKLNVFRDDEDQSKLNFYDNKPFPFVPSAHSRSDVRDRFALHPNNHVPQLSNHTQSSSSSLHESATAFHRRDTGRSRGGGLSFPRQPNHNLLGNYQRPDSPYSLDGRAFYNQSALASMSHQPAAVNPNQYRLNLHDQTHDNHDYYASAGQDYHSFLSHSGANPLYSQDPLFLRSYDRYQSRNPFSLSSSFAETRCDENNTSSSNQVEGFKQHDVKLEQLCDSIELPDQDATKLSPYAANPQWDASQHLAPSDLNNPDTD